MFYLLVWSETDYVFKTSVHILFRSNLRYTEEGPLGSKAFDWQCSAKGVIRTQRPEPIIKSKPSHMKRVVSDIRDWKRIVFLPSFLFFSPPFLLSIAAQNSFCFPFYFTRGKLEGDSGEHNRKSQVQSQQTGKWLFLGRAGSKRIARVQPKLGRIHWGAGQGGHAGVQSGS